MIVMLLVRTLLSAATVIFVIAVVDLSLLVQGGLQTMQVVVDWAFQGLQWTGGGGKEEKEGGGVRCHLQFAVRVQKYTSCTNFLSRSLSLSPLVSKPHTLTDDGLCSTVVPTAPLAFESFEGVKILLNTSRPRDALLSLPLVEEKRTCRREGRQSTVGGSGST